MLDEIIEIEELLDEYTEWDIETKTNNFYANNILVHNSSFTAYLKDGVFGVCSRNLDLKETEGSKFWCVARQLNIEEKLRRLTNVLEIPDVAIQGEMIGEGIQKNKLKIKGNNLRVFNVFDVRQGRYLDFEELVDACRVMNIDTVPIIDSNFILSDYPSVKELVDFATRKSVINSNAWAEGYVFRPVKELNLPKFGRCSFKVINPNFLLANNE